ncbi:glycoside hydrolase family 3 protein [Phycicoccus sp. BSK3Z-2]|uniref:Glycoside hydrolase family 3 protein n=1 Tax=Phycicoccus avicenniae TaxID=2828860 RepID=A0A941HYZ3_9MICO|nr:glycoside hydrolase family 3 C-terminal domain-containing protein [Phycicoccus avicenniae]MBR7741711.1 glycoside hydrolase family 3 protein [Phycicoccus avicenniae]
MTDLDLDHPVVTAACERLTLEQKVRLLTGQDFWSTYPVEEVGLRSLVLSDGPSGVRGPVWDERSPSLNLPSATALASSWDPDVARRYGEISAAEARRKDVDVVLGPTINLHRSPLGGRHFEAFSEDPLLTGRLAAAYVAGCQGRGVGATPKHYVANDWETDRFTASAQVSERALRELYLAAFEEAVVEGRPWMLMSAYNSVNGTTASEHPLLADPLKEDWGFDGVVVSDWGGVRSLDAARAAQDLAMPGPDGPWGEALVAAVREGAVPESAVDDKVRRILLLAARVGGLEGVAVEPVEHVGPAAGVAFAREAAVEGTVLLENDGVLPLDPQRVRRVAVLGQNADTARTQGGGSATVLPERVVSPLEGIREALPDADVTYAVGALAHTGLSELPLSEVTDPETGEPGVLVRFLDEDDGVLWTEHRRSTALVYFGGEAPVAASTWFEVVAEWTPSEDGPVDLGFESVGHGTVDLDGERVLEETAEAIGDQLGASILHPPAARATVEVVAGRRHTVRLRFDMRTRDRMMEGAFGLTLGTAPAPRDPEALVADAVAAAHGADVAVVVVGTSSKEESEGFDRESLELPGAQDRLVAAVAASGTPTVVVVNSGSPVLLPWRADVAALLVGYFGGQEMGRAVADVLTGAAEPGGRLPTTWPAAQADLPVQDVTPVDGVLAYDEGVHIGHRAWLRAGTTPAYWFGAGRGYTTWEVDTPTLDGAPDGVTVRTRATNTGDRAGKHVVQVYLERPGSAVDRPARWFAGHAVVRAVAGEGAPVTVDLGRRRFAHWDEAAGDWAVEPGEYLVHVAESVDRVLHTARVVVADDWGVVPA